MAKQKKKHKKKTQRKHQKRLTGPVKATGFSSIRQEFQNALACHRAGQYDKAESLFQSILSRYPDHADTLHLLGLVHYQTGRLATAIELIRKAIAIQPKVSIYWFNLAGIFRREGQNRQAMDGYEEAIRIDPEFAPAYNEMGAIFTASGQPEKAMAMYQKAVAIRPDYAEVWYNMGNIMSDTGREKEAVGYYQKALDIRPEFAEAWYNLGNAWKSLKSVDAAISCFKNTVRIQPDMVDAWNNLGIVYRNSHQHQQAMECFRKALEIDANYYPALNNMGLTFNHIGHVQNALSCYQRALAIHPQYVEAMNNMASTLSGMGRSQEAIDLYRKALAIRPDHVGALINLARVLADQGDTRQAISYYEKAIAIDPKNASALNNLGNVLVNLGRTEEAIDCFRRALESDPDNDDAFTNYFHQLQRTCAWEEMARLAPILDEKNRACLRQHKRVPETPFIQITRIADPEQNLAVARSWADHMASRMAHQQLDFSFEFRKKPKNRLTIGFVSADFRDHPVSHLMTGFFRHYDRQRFQVHCYSIGPDDGSWYRQFIATHCDTFVDLKPASLQDAARTIYQDQVDILLDLMGHTSGNRMEIFALRPAPIQVSYLGYPGTTGAAFIDYVITDPTVTPPEHEPFFTEKFVYLGHCFQINDNQQAISHIDWTPATFGLPEGRIILGCFNQAYKLDPMMFQCWMRIMARVPDSVLWLAGTNTIAQRNLKRQALACGVDPQRLFFATRIPEKADYLARLGLCHLALDTRIYNGHTSTTDALWAGVPVISLMGTHFASRVSASILNAAGLGQLVTRSLDEYEALAVHLATHPDALNQIRRQLEQNRRQCPLFDTVAVVRQLEKAFDAMWQQWMAGHPPQIISPESL